MDRAELQRTLLDRLNEATRYLRPLFRTQARLVFRIHVDEGFGVVKELNDGSVPLITIKLRQPTYTNSDKDTDLYGKMPSNLDLGTTAAQFLYHVVNPELFGNLRRYQEDEVKAFISNASSREQRALAQAHTDLDKIVKYCCGHFYSTIKTHFDGAPHETIPSRIIELTEQIAIGPPSLGSELASMRLVKEYSGEHIRRIARELLVKRQLEAISDLARLNFEQARSYILQHTGVDILKVPYIDAPAKIGRMAEPPKSVS